MAVPEKLRWKLTIKNNKEVAPLALALVEAAEKQGATLEHFELACGFAVYMIRTTANIDKRLIRELSGDAKAALKSVGECTDTIFE